MMKSVLASTAKFVLIIAAFVALLVLNWKVWVKDRDNERLIQDLQTEHKIQLEENAKMQATNAELRRRIDSLKRGSVEMIEEEARDTFGMVGEDETYFDFNASADNASKK